MRSWPRSRRALELLHVPVTGRTHGMHAEPTTFGAKFALWTLQADRDRRRHAGGPRQERWPWAKLSRRGRHRARAHRPGRRGERVRCALGLTPSTGHPGGGAATATPSTSTPARPSGRPWSSCAPRSGTWPAASSERRRSPSAPARRAARPCPTSATRSWPNGLCGLGPACCGAYLGAGLEDVALWHERDISHSSVSERGRPARTPRCLARVMSCARRPAWPRAW